MTRSITTFVAGALVALCLTATVSAQSVLLNEDFSSAVGTTPPTGWTTSMSGTNPTPWRFDNPGSRSIDYDGGGLQPWSAPFAIVDSDNAGSGVSGISTMTSGAFDASTALTANLTFDQQLRDLSSGWSIEIWDGVMWNVVDAQANNTTSISIGYPNPSASAMYDVTAAAGASASAQLRFVHEYSWDWWWAIDNVKIEEPPAFDLLMVSVDNPNFSDELCFLPTSNSTVSCTVQNNGGALIPTGTLVTMQLRVDGVNIASEPYALAADLAPGATYSYTYTAGSPITTSGPHDIFCRVIIGGDANAANDSVTRNYTLGVPQVAKLPGWVEDFESHTVSDNSRDVPAGWVNNTDDMDDTSSSYSDWRSQTGGTPSGVGPTFDHTTGLSTGWYMNTEDSGSNGTSICLTTPCLDLSTAVNPTLLFYFHSNEDPAGTYVQPLVIDVIDETNGGVVTMNVATYLTNGVGTGWEAKAVDLSPFAPAIVKCVFRSTNNVGTSFYDDNAIDDVGLVDLVFDVGQAPRPGMAVFDINASSNLLGFGVQSNQPGPYFTDVTQGGQISFDFSGEANQPLTSFFAPLNRGSATFGAVGQMDCGVGAIDPGTGFPVDLLVFGNGILWATTPGAGFGFDAFWLTDGAGAGNVTLNMPNFGLAPGSVLTTFQFGILSAAAPFAYLSNAVEVTVQ